MIPEILISAMMAVSPFHPKTPIPDVPKQYAILTSGEES